MPDRSTAPLFKKIESIELEKAKKYSLDNGISLFVINSGSQPVIRLEIITKSSNWSESRAGLSHFTAKMLTEGSKQKTSKEISYFFDRYGAFIEINPGLDYTIITLYALSKHLENLLPVLKEIIFEPAFPERELEIMKKIKIQNNKVNYEKTNFLASLNFRKKIFGEDHPYGRELEEEAISSLSRDEIRQHYNSFFLKDWQILISGEIQEHHINLVNKHFGHHTNEVLELNGFMKPEPQTGRTVIEKQESLQSTIRLGKVLIKRGHPDFQNLQVVNEVLGGYFGSRLMKNIREDKGFTYGIQSNIVALKNEGYLVIGTDVKTENTAQTLDEIYKEIKILQEVPIENQELETIKNYMTGSFLSEINTPFALADKFKSIHLNNLDYDFYQNYIQAINTIKSDDILKLAQEYLGNLDMVEVIAGGVN